MAGTEGFPNSKLIALPTYSYVLFCVCVCVCVCVFIKKIHK